MLTHREWIFQVKLARQPPAGTVRSYDTEALVGNWEVCLLFGASRDPDLPQPLFPPKDDPERVASPGNSEPGSNEFVIRPDKRVTGFHCPSIPSATLHIGCHSSSHLIFLLQLALFPHLSSKPTPLSALQDSSVTCFGRR